jgi:hypothetical protein
LFSSFQSMHLMMPSCSKVTNVKRSCCQAIVVNLFEHQQTCFLSIIMIFNNKHVLYWLLLHPTLSCIQIDKDYSINGM